MRALFTAFWEFWLPGTPIEDRASRLYRAAQHRLLEAQRRAILAGARVTQIEAELAMLRGVAGVDNSDSPGHNDIITPTGYPLNGTPSKS